MSEKISVMVTGVGGVGTSRDCQSITVSRRYTILGRGYGGIKLCLIDVDEAYTVPPASDSHYIDVLLDICQQRQIKVLIHGSEPELKVISRNQIKY